MSAAPALFGVPLKYISLVTLTLQNSLLTILLHYSRTSGASYSSALAVLANELLKGSISFGVALRNTYQVSNSSLPSNTLGSAAYTKLGGSNSAPHSRQGSFSAASARPMSPGGMLEDDWRRRGQDFGVRLKKIRREIFSPDCWKLSIPAILYVIQNNLQFVAASNLDVATFQVSYQMKILTTALFSVLMLKRKLTLTKWVSLLFLAIGVGIVQIQSSTSKTPSTSSHQMDPTTGFLAVAMACLTSGLAGVYFEMVLKGSTTDLWIRNVQLSIFSLVPAVLPLLADSFSLFSSSKTPTIPIEPVGGFLLPGFGFWAWATVLCQVLGGLVTALVIKFSDNIMKGFATSLSIVISFMAGIVLFDFNITTSFIVGCSVVLAATYSYNKPSASGAASTHTPLRRVSVDKSSGSAHSVSYAYDSPETSDRRRGQFDATSPTTSVHGASQVSQQHQSHLSAQGDADGFSSRKSGSRSMLGLGDSNSSSLGVSNAPMVRTPSGGWAAAMVGAKQEGDTERGLEK